MAKHSVWFEQLGTVGSGRGVVLCFRVERYMPDGQALRWV